VHSAYRGDKLTLGKRAERKATPKNYLFRSINLEFTQFSQAYNLRLLQSPTSNS